MSNGTPAIAARLPRWLRVVFVGCLVLVATGATLYAYRAFTLPVTLTVAAGSLDGEAARLMTALAGRLTSNKADVRLKVIDAGSTLQAAREFAAGNADLALVRADSKELSDARTVVQVTHGVVMILVPAMSKVDGMDELRNTTIGMLGGEINSRIAELIGREYDFQRMRVRVKEVSVKDAADALRLKHIGAILAVLPVSERYLTLLRGLFPAVSSKETMRLLPLDSADAIAQIEKAYESHELPKGTLRGSPPIPDEDVTTLRVPYFLVARKTLDDDTAGNLAAAVMTARSQLLADHPVAAQMAAPDTDKDAFIPVHPGAAAYYDGTRVDFLDKYANALFFGPMLLGGLASIFAALWKFVGAGGRAELATQMRAVEDFTTRVRNAGDETELTAIENDLDAVLQRAFAVLARDEKDASQFVAVGLVAQRIDGLIRHRRDQLHVARPALTVVHGRRPDANA
jgi:TRAP-type uncharacterized transport system substrate-binding protein